MNAQQKWIMAATGFIFLLVIAGFGYQELKKEAERQEVRTMKEKQETEEESAGDTESTGTGRENEEEQQETEVTAAPDFTVWDQEGKEVTLLDILDGKPGVLNFWTSKCPPCKEEMPEFQEVYEEMGDEIQFIMLDGVGCMGETEESGKEYVEEQGFSFPVYYDLEMNAVSTYGIQAFPTTFFIDKEGNIAAGRMGMLTKDILLQGIEMIK